MNKKSADVNIGNLKSSFTLKRRFRPSIYVFVITRPSPCSGSTDCSSVPREEGLDLLFNHWNWDQDTVKTRLPSNFHSLLSIKSDT